MKKLTCNLQIYLLAILISTLFSCKAQDFNKCADLTKPIDLGTVVNYIQNYYDIVKHNPNNAIGQIELSTTELKCLSKITNKALKFINAATISTDSSSTIIIVEVNVKSKISFYNLDDLFPGSKGRISLINHHCPPPTPCPVPLTNDDL